MSSNKPTMQETMDWFINLMKLKNEDKDKEYEALQKMMLHKQAHFNYTSQIGTLAAHSRSILEGNTLANIHNHVQQNKNDVFCFYDQQQYGDDGQAPSHEAYQLNRFLVSVRGGEEIKKADDTDPAGKSDVNGRPYPLNITKDPSHNLLVATNQQVTGHSGYFGIGEGLAKTSIKYDEPHQADIIVGSDIEFETYTRAQLRDNKCPFIKPLSLQEDNKTYLKLDNLSEEGQDDLYLDVTAYKQEVKLNLLNKLKAELVAHHQAPNASQDIEFNTALPGMGFFANIEGDPHYQYHIGKYLAEPAAEAYREALQELDNFQKDIPNGFGKIKKFRLVRPEVDKCKYEKEAIDTVFDKIMDGNYQIGDIKVAANADLVENYTHSDPSLHQASYVGGDVRAAPGNELSGSQEPGVFANIPGLRQLMCVHQNPFMMLKQVAYGAIDQLIGQKAANSESFQHAGDELDGHLENLNKLMPYHKKNQSEFKETVKNFEQIDSIKRCQAKVNGYLNGNITCSRFWHWHGAHGRNRANVYKELLESDKPAIQLSAILAILNSPQRSSLKESVFASLQQVYGKGKTKHDIAAIIREQILALPEGQNITGVNGENDLHKKIIEPIMSCADQKVYYSSGKNNTSLTQKDMKNWNQQLRENEHKLDDSDLYTSIASFN